VFHVEQIHTLVSRARAVDRRGYGDYEQLRGSYAGTGLELRVDHVQGDPFAEPSRLRAFVPAATAALPRWATASPAARTATADFLNRRLQEACHRHEQRIGSGRSGELRILAPGQEVLERTSIRVEADGSIEARVRVGLPAEGRRILGDAAAHLLGTVLPTALREGLVLPAEDHAALQRHVQTVANARALREQLAPRGLIAFVADGALLARRSGVDDRPLLPPAAVAFRAPSSLRVTLDTPHAGPVTGLGVPAGITLVVGGGFHGKSTLLRAIERGVYDHVPGDGRERVVTASGAVKVRAEDGRAVAGTDIRNFIAALPGGGDTRRFTTTNASGSTSQAAAIIEALEVGATCLLLDEDTSATNFMIRDARMQTLVPGELEPITPYLDRARQLADEQSVSSIIVVGGSGDYLDIADTVIAMQAYLPVDVTARAAEVVAALPTRRAAAAASWQQISPRAVEPETLDPRSGRRAVHLKAWAEDRAQFGTEEVDLTAVEQIVERAQTRAMAHALAAARGRELTADRPLPAAIADILHRIETHGLDAVQTEPTGELAAFRAFELSAFLNRIRTLATRPL
jgi:predicted ABC-class ATPase